MAEVPDALRRRLGWGLVHELRVTAGTLLLYPAWLYHAPLRSGRTDEWVTKQKSETCWKNLIKVELNSLTSLKYLCLFIEVHD